MLVSQGAGEVGSAVPYFGDCEGRFDDAGVEGRRASVPAVQHDYTGDRV